MLNLAVKSRIRAKSTQREFEKAKYQRVVTSEFFGPSYPSQFYYHAFNFSGFQEQDFIVRKDNFAGLKGI